MGNNVNQWIGTVVSICLLSIGSTSVVSARPIVAQVNPLNAKLRVLGSQDRYAAIWNKSSSTPWVARHGMTSAQYQAEFDKYIGQGYRLVQVSGYGVNGQDRYAAIWDKSPSTAWVARHGMTSAQYQSEFDKYVAQGYRLVQVSGYGVNGQDRYAAIWDKSPSTAWVARHGMTSAQYQAEFDKYIGQGYRLVQVSGYGVNGRDLYAAIWDKSPSTAWVARHGMTSAQYQAEFDKYIGQGYRLVQVSGYGVNGRDLYAAIWDKSSSPAWVARHGMTSAQYQAEFDKYVAQGYHLVDVSGYGK
jgi:cytochrome c biogenesis factor